MAKSRSRRKTRLKPRTELSGKTLWLVITIPIVVFLLILLTKSLYLSYVQATSQRSQLQTEPSSRTTQTAITGTAYSSLGGTLEGVKVEAGAGRTGIKPVWTDAQGKYTLSDLPGTEGTYYVMTVYYSKRGYENKTLWVGVTAGTTTVQDVTLQKL